MRARTGTRRSRALGLAHGDALKEHAELRAQQVEIGAAKDLGHERAALAQHEGGDVERLRGKQTR